MEFEYEISFEDYVAGLLLYRQLNRDAKAAFSCFVVGVLMLVIGVTEREKGLSPLLAVLLGAFVVWCGVVALFPRFSARKRYRKHYREVDMEGKRYRASVNEVGMVLGGEDSTKTTSWAEVSSKGENQQVFMFYSGGALHIFAKRFLDDAQQERLRVLAGLPAR